MAGSDLAAAEDRVAEERLVNTMVRPVIAMTSAVAPVPLRDAEPDATGDVEPWYSRRPESWYSKLLWAVVLILVVPVGGFLLWGFDLALAAVFGAVFGPLIGAELRSLFTHLYLDD
jgi:hypothetical protein